ncbi:MAG: tetratricopeptide repeat protein [Thermodesulfobacteriota bacterium]
MVRLPRSWTALALGCLVLACALPRPAACSSLDDARTAYKAGLRAYRGGDIGEALRLFRASEQADPSYPFPPFALGRIYQELFDQETRFYEEGIAAYERLALLLRINPPAPKDRALYQVLYFLGLFYLKGGDYPQAQAALQQFLEISPDFDNPEAVHNAIGIALYYQDQYDGAVEQFRTALARNPSFAEARFNLRSVFTRLAVYNESVVLSRAGEAELALDKIERLKEFAPRYLPGRHLEARILNHLGRTEEALRVYSEILGFDPGAPLTFSVRLEMARLLATRGKAEEARSLLLDNLNRFPDLQDERLQREAVEMLVKVGVKP